MSPNQIPHSATNVIFAALDSGGRAVLVARRISEAIAMGILAEGERLPSETALAVQFGVSIMTLREALSELRHRGLVETRRGRGGGTFVSKGTTPPNDRLKEQFLAFATDEMREMGDHAAAIGGAAAKLAARRASSADISRLAQHVEALTRSREGASGERADMRFHVELAAAAHSARLARDELAWRTAASSFLWRLAAANHRDHVGTHRAILAAIVARDGDKARALAEEHVERDCLMLISLQHSLRASMSRRRTPEQDSAVQRAVGVLDNVAVLLDDVFRSINDLESEVLVHHVAATRANRRLRPSDLANIRHVAQAALSRHMPLLAGAGVVFAEDVIEGRRRWIEWWYASLGGPSRRLIVSLDADDLDFYDYDTAEWFDAPRLSGNRSIVGPFLDYSGSTDRHFTLTMPLHDSQGEERRFLGVAGADVPVRKLEPIVEPLLHAIGCDAVLVNGKGTVIVSNTGRYITGELLADADISWMQHSTGRSVVREDGVALARDRRLPWAVLIPRSGRQLGVSRSRRATAAARYDGVRDVTRPSFDDAEAVEGDH